MWISVQAKWHDSICPIWVIPKLRQYFSCLSFTNKAWTFPRTQVAETVCPHSGCLRTGKSCSPNALNHSLGALVQPQTQDGRCHLLKYRVQFWSVFISYPSCRTKNLEVKAECGVCTMSSSSFNWQIILSNPRRNELGVFSIALLLLFSLRLVLLEIGSVCCFIYA